MNPEISFKAPRTTRWAEYWGFFRYTKTKARARPIFCPVRGVRQHGEGGASPFHDLGIRGMRVHGRDDGLHCPGLAQGTSPSLPHRDTARRHARVALHDRI